MRNLCHRHGLPQCEGAGESPRFSVENLALGWPVVELATEVGRLPIGGCIAVLETIVNTWVASVFDPRGRRPKRISAISEGAATSKPEAQAKDAPGMP